MRGWVDKQFFVCLIRIIPEPLFPSQGLQAQRNRCLGQHLWQSEQRVGTRRVPSRRFRILNRYSHISDLRQENPTDKLAKIRPLISKLEKAVQDVYVPGKNISIEGLVKFNGRLSFKQYMPKKPNKFGIKVWMLADSETYFVPRFHQVNHHIGNLIGCNCSKNYLYFHSDKVYTM
jgi:hypothetical protein